MQDSEATTGAQPEERARVYVKFSNGREFEITDHVAAMYDALVNSVEWGSDFLEASDIESVVLVGRLVGFDVPDETIARDDSSKRISGKVTLDDLREAWKRRLAQITAKAAAIRAGEDV